MKTKSLGLALCFAFIVAGCRGPVAPEPADKQELNVVRNAFRDFFKANEGQRAANYEQLIEYIDNQEKPVFEKVRNGEIVVVWNLTEADFKSQPNGVVAYRKGIESSGGPVLLGDYSIKKMTASEFATAPKAKGN